MKASITDVSKKAGVSTMTVSRVVRGEPLVKDKTRQKVMSAIKELGYLPSQAARSLRSKSSSSHNNSHTCCCLIFGEETQVGDAFFRDIARAAEKEAIKNNLCLLQTHWQNTFEESWKRLASISSVPGLCGFILAGQFSRQDVDIVRKNSQNIVIIDGPVPSCSDDIEIASVEADYYFGSRLAIEHLISKGAKKILVITGPEQGHYFAESMRRAANSLAEHCEKIDILDSDLTLESGVNIILEAFKRSKAYDAVFTNDEVALGALRAFAQLDIKVPQDVMIVGFDNISYSSYLSPTLTTVNIDKSLMGKEAVKSLIEQLEGDGQEKSEQVKKVLKASLVIRESTGGN